MCECTPVCVYGIHVGAKYIELSNHGYIYIYANLCVCVCVVNSCWCLLY